MSNGALQAIGAEIIAMSNVDQTMRRSEIWDTSVDRKHTTRMQQIVAQIGWPTVSKVGRQASHMAWLLVQHACHDRDFQRACLALMKNQPPGEVSPQNIAYLEDRVRVSEGRSQIYGTQFHANSHGEFEPFPIEDPEQIDARRAKAGMGTFAEYAAQIRLYRKSPHP